MKLAFNEINRCIKNVSNSNDNNIEKINRKQQTTAQTESSSENMHNVEKSNYQTTKRKTKLL